MRQENAGVSRRTFLGSCAGGLALGACATPATSGPMPGHATRIELARPAPMLPPAQAVLLTVRGMPGDPDEISVVWTFVVNGNPPQVGISVAHEHVAQRLVANHREFVLNVPVASLVEPFDRVDMASTRVGDKFELSGLTRGRATRIDAPAVAEAPIQVECRVQHELDVPPARKLFVAEVVATTVLPGVCDDAERLLVGAVPLFGMTVGSGEFFTMGKRVGHIGQTEGAPPGKYRY